MRLKNTVPCAICKRRLAAYGERGPMAFEIVTPEGVTEWRCEKHLDDGDAVFAHLPEAYARRESRSAQISALIARLKDQDGE